jgi:hypothetical protein
MTDFRIDVFQNEYLPDGGTGGTQQVNAIVTVTASGAGQVTQSGGGVPAAEVIVVDCSGSMGYPASKMSEAKRATAAAIDTLRDGVPFAVIAGTHEAKMAFPAGAYLVPASAESRAAAKQAVQQLSPGGGTAIGSWLRLTDQVFAGHPSPIRHAILLTDGNNQHETAEQLDAALAATAGHFTCDARGVGTDWVVAELRKVAQALLGTVDIIADPSGLEADFRAMAEKAMGKAVGDVRLRVWTPQGAVLRFVKQVLPEVADLTGKRMGPPPASTGPNTGEYPTGAWGDESRDYHIAVDVPNGAAGQEMLAARVALVVPGADGADQVAAQGLVRAVWTDDEALSTRINPQVAHYTGQAELASAIQEGLQARRDGDEDTATTRLGRAVKLAHESGNADMARLLEKVVDVEDLATGTVRLKKTVADLDEMNLDTQSTKTARVSKTAPGQR